MVIPENGCCATITVTGREDLDTDAETIRVTVQNGQNNSYAYSDPRTAQIDIGDNDVSMPTVTITVTPGSSSPSETGPAPGRFTVSRMPVTNAELLVRYAPNPTSRAKEITDFNQLAHEIRIPPMAPSAEIQIIPLDDSCFEGPEPITVDLEPGANYTSRGHL